MKNGLARGVRQASDFLMALQLTGAAKTNSVANLQLRMPIVVIGGGLTAIDTATESLAYYPVQVEKFLERYETLVAEARRSGGARQLERGRARDRRRVPRPRPRDSRRARAGARARGREPNFAALLNTWGGVTIAYRRRLIDAPSYTLNHEEVPKALEEGIRFAECLTPGRGRGRSSTATPRRCKRRRAARTARRSCALPARSILVAAGTQPNTVLAREDDNVLPRRQVVPGGRRGRPAGRSRSASPSPTRRARADVAAIADGRASQLLRRSAPVASPATW